MNPELEKFAAAAYSSKETIQNTYDQAVYCIKKSIKGCFMECGVAAGAQIGVMGFALDKYEDDRPIYAYDSFQGIPFCSENDDQEPGLYYLTEPKPFVKDKESLLVSTGATVHSLESVKSNIKNWGLSEKRFMYVEGWFQHTIAKRVFLFARSTERIALLRLDGDLYESTMVCLKRLFPMVVKGGIVIIDDYALAGCRKACDEYFEKIDYKPKYKKVKDSTPVWFKVV